MCLPVVGAALMTAHLAQMMLVQILWLYHSAWAPLHAPVSR